MAKKKGKRVDPGKIAALAARKDAKAEKAALKRESKVSGGGDSSVHTSSADLDGLLELYKQQDRLSLTAAAASGKQVALEGFPLARANATFTITTDSKKKDVYLFGGEYFDGAAIAVSDQLFKFEISHHKWKQVIGTRPPPPRCAHSAVYYNRCLFVFGGEATSASDFAHYKDVWKYDTVKLQWTEIRSPGGPSSRSGHSAVVWKHFMIVFGGFFEAADDTPRWFNDIAVMNLQTEQWMDIPHSKLSIRPEPRSGCNTALINDEWVVHGGFSKRLDRRRATATDDQQQDQKPAPEGQVFSDAWVLRLEPLLTGSSPVWERYLSTVSDQALRGPNGRSGVGSVSYNKNMLLFGGVVDQELHHHMVNSVFYDDLYMLNFEKRKFLPIHRSSKQGEQEDTESSGWGFEKLKRTVLGEADQLDKDNTTGPMNLLCTEPLPRIKPCLAVDGPTLYLYGGLLEVGDRECTLDDMWCIELRKKRVWECIFPGTMDSQVWKGETNDDDSSHYSNAESANQADESSSEEETKESEKEDTSKLIQHETSQLSSSAKDIKKQIKKLVERYDLNDPSQSPEQDESAIEFYTRSSTYWDAKAASCGMSGSALAEQRFTAVRPIIATVEQLMEEYKAAKAAEKEK